MLLYWIWFAHRPGVTNRMKRNLLRYFRDPEEIFFAGDRAFEGIEGITPEAVAGLTDRDISGAERIYETCIRGNIRLLTWKDAAYPNRLKNITDPPMVLYYKGSLPDIDGSPVIGVVGTRKATLYGLDVAQRMGYQISRCGGIVVSGMAAGIDARAMHGGLMSGRSVIGILGCGVDVVYPASNRELYKDVERHGCLISEFPPGTPPNKWNFPMRNRVISGISCGVLVVEAPERSGALITARQAAEQGRDVFVVPGNIDNPACVGSNRLMRDGAMPVGCGWDVMAEYEGIFPGKVQQTGARELLREPMEIPENSRPEKPGQKPQSREPEEKTTKKVIDKEQSASYSDVNDTLPQLSEEERILVDALKDGVWHADELIAHTGMGTGKLLGLLTVLEIRGVITRLPGKRFCLRER